MELTLESLGFTKEELQNRVIEQLCREVMVERGVDDEGNEGGKFPSRIAEQLKQVVKDQINATIASIAEKHILPNVHAYIENLTLQETNRWGEKTKTPVTFIEYLTARAEAYLKEEVNFEGKNKEEAGGYSWSKSQTRIAHLVHRHPRKETFTRTAADG